MRALLRPTAVLFLLLTLITGLLYPLVLTCAAQSLFPAQANGSLIVKDGRTIGSQLIGQAFDEPRYFWGRPSATDPYPYNASASSGSNLGPTNPVLKEAVRLRIVSLRAADGSGRTETRIPVDLVTTSASGLDPDISPAAALTQVPRVARVRGVSETTLRDLLRRHVEDRTLHLLGEPRVNVLRLNMALDDLARMSGKVIN
jgi:K+-transporting ATPase ATPase C chain